MGAGRIDRLRLAIWLICVCALANVRMLFDAFHQFGNPPQADSQQIWIARFEPFRPLLPEGTVTGFLVDQAHADVKLKHPAERLALARYALAPRLVEGSPAHALVITDSDDPASLPEIAVGEHWTLVAALGNGARLFRTRPED
jgi:hypothetical protein